MKLLISVNSCKSGVRYNMGNMRLGENRKRCEVDGGITYIVRYVGHVLDDEYVTGERRMRRNGNC
jgi:hypothetical protein